MEFELVLFEEDTTLIANTALPAEDLATTEAVPSVLLAVNPIDARPLAAVVAVAVVTPPVRVPEPAVITS